MNEFMFKLKRRLGLVDEFSDEGLRAFFRQKYNISVGRYSYGCFDRSRIDPNVTVGRYCSFAPSVHIFRRNHGVSFLGLTPFFYNSRLGLVERDTIAYAPLLIEDDVWLGHNAAILPGVTRIGRGAVVAAGAIVSRDVEPYSIVAGNPARELRKRFEPDVIARIEQSQWWMRDPVELKRLYAAMPEAVFNPANQSFSNTVFSEFAQ